MKIIQVSTYFHPAVGGVERQVEEIAAHLQQNGHEVTVFTTDANHGQIARMQRLQESYRGLKVRRFRYVIKLGNFLRFAPMLAWELLRADYDLIHVHNTHDGHLLPAILIKLLRKKKIVVTGHNPFVVTSDKRGDKLHFAVGFYDWVFKIFSRWIDAYIALLQSEKEFVQKNFKIPEQKIHVVPNGIQDIFYTDSGDKEKFYNEWSVEPERWSLIVGAACRLNFVKGLQNLVHAAQNLPQVLFVFAGGDDGYGSALHRQFRDLPNVLFTDEYILSEQMPDFLQAIDLFVLPSIYEPFGMTLVEAMAQGKFIISSNVGGPNEIITPEVGELLPPTNQELWTNRIDFWRINRAELGAKTSACKQEADKYRWEKVITQIEAVYAKL